MNNYLIPANSKKSQLILGYFTPTDLVLVLVGCGLTILMLLIATNASGVQKLIMLIPGLISALLVAPVMYYHNVLQFLINIFTYIFNPRRYYWKGWCASDESEVK